MKKILFIFFVMYIIMQFVHAQDSTYKSEQYRIGLTGRILPKKNFLFFELEADKRIKSFYSFGGKVGHIKISQSFTGFNFTRSYISGGITFHLLKHRKFFIDPSTHLMYLRFVRVEDGSHFDGGGIMGSIRIGYNFGRFGVGVKALSTFNIGRTVNNLLEIKIFDYYFDEFQYGFHLSYKI